jgi:nucleoside-diphosphate-sugar epimerase
MRVLIAGGAGFLGTAMSQQLLDRGDEVVSVDNLVTGAAANLEGLLDRRGFEFVEADVTEGVPAIGRIDSVVNLASPASPVDFGPLALEILDVGSRGVANLLDMAHRHGARFLQASTSEVYGEPLVHPQPESYWGNVNPIGLRSVYDEAKRFAEALTIAYRRRHGLDVRVARIFNTYGPGMRSDDGRIVSTFVTQAISDQPITIHGDGSQTRSFCYVADEVTGLLALLDSDLTGPVNVGSDDERTVLELAELVRELSGSRSEIVFTDRPADDPSRRRPDLALARSQLGWSPQTTLRDGLAQTIAWFRDRLSEPDQVLNQSVQTSSG